MRVDYHVHPNLQAKNPEKRLRALWHAFGDVRLDAVVCTEHVFKDAPAAYRRLIAAKPKDAKTHIYPGAELLTKEDIDVIVFARHDWYDEHPELLVPYGMPLRQMIDRLEASGLTYFIPHPYIANNKLKRLFPDPTEFKEFLGTVQGFEVANGALLQLWRLLRLPGLKRSSRRVRDRICSTAAPAMALFPAARTFVAAGSDAHHPDELGSVYVELDCADESYESVFHAMTTNTDVSRVWMAADRFHPHAFVSTTFTAFTENWMKREVRKRQRKYDEQLTRDAFVTGELAEVTVESF